MPQSINKDLEDGEVALGVRATHLHASAGFLAILESSNLNLDNPRTFQTIISEALSHYDITRSEMAEEFGFSVSTPTRWASGTAAPHPMARPVIVNWIRSKVESRIGSLMVELNANTGWVDEFQTLVRHQLSAVGETDGHKPPKLRARKRRSQKPGGARARRAAAV